MKKTSTTYLLLFTATFSLCIFSFLFYQRIQLLMDSYELVNRSTQVSLQAEKFFLGLRDAALNYRDYLRTHDKNSLNLFNEKINEYPKVLDAIDKLEADNIEQQKRIKNISGLCNDYKLYVLNILQLDKQNQLTPALIDTARSKLNNIRARLDELINSENLILKQRDDELNKHIFTTPLFLLIFSLASIAIATSAFLSIIKQIRKNKMLEINETRLRESEERFRQLADLIPQIVWTARTDGYYDYYNKRWYEYTGFDESFGDQSWIPILHPDDVQTCIDAWYHSVKTGEPYFIEYRFKDKNNTGKYRWFLGKALPIKNKDGEIIKWFGTCTDIHDQKTATEKLEQLVKERAAELTAKNKDLNEAQRLAHIGSWEWDIKDNKIFWSDELYRIYGLSRENFKTDYENYTMLIHKDDREYSKKIIEEALTEKKPFEFYHRIQRPDGNIRMVHGRGEVYVDESGEAVRMAGTSQDITEQHNKELQMIEQNVALEKMNKELASFSYVASHDLQEPLRKIKMFTKRLMEKDIESMSDDSKQYFNRIENAATRMQQLIDDLLSYSRTNTIHAHFETTNLDKLLEDVSDNLSEKISQTNAVIESLGLATANVIPFQFQQLLTNLITNSMKFARKGVAPHIRISHSVIIANAASNFPDKRGTKYHHYVISDNGIGFEPQYNEKVFELFQRLHGRNEFEGTGIGLAICKKIAENHNGFITANGSPDKGATFNIYIPVEQDHVKML